MKTISDLNNKVWYRFLKVVFILVFVITCAIPVFLITDEIGTYQNDHKVVCNYGNKSSFLAYKDKEILLSSYEDYSESLANLTETAREDLRAACEVSDEEVENLIKSYFEGDNSDRRKLYDITEEKVPLTTPLGVTLGSLLSILIVSITFELARRAFYYIILGTILPKK